MRVNFASDFADELLDMPKRARGARYWLAFAPLSLIVLVGVSAWVYQLFYGLGVTGLNQPVYWAIYITNFVFFIGISHAGTLISAILRLTNAEWRRPVTRMAEAITVFALFLGASMIIVDMGRPDRILNTIWYGRIQSPLLWDVLSIFSYLFGSIVYLYIPLIPDIAMMRDRSNPRGFLYRFYRLLSLNWYGTEMQKERLERAIRASAIMIVPLAVSVHTVVSYVFAMTLRPMWHSTIFGPYFVIGAIYSGIAALLIAMVIAQKSLHLSAYLKEVHFRNLAYLLLLMFGAWFYATIGEYLVTGYGNMAAEMRVLISKVQQDYAWAFWGMIFAMFAAFFILTPFDRLVRAIRLPVWRTNTLAAFLVAIGGWCGWFALVQSNGFTSAPSVIVGVIYALAFFLIIIPSLRRDWFSISLYASILVVLGMWLERFTIVVPTLTRPMQEGAELGAYIPTWVEIAITVSAFSCLALFFLLFAKVFPLVSVWEIAEGIESSEKVKERLSQYLPEEVSTAGDFLGGEKL